jgi:two-component system nitrogen regulation sensor histidine kinase NtrY
MRKRFLYGAGIAALAVLVTLVVWQGSFNFGDYGPSNPAQTFLYWVVSTLVFLLTVTLGFILFRTGVKLYIERRKGREGSRIKTKLVIGALALSFMPVFFLVMWSVSVLNRNLDKWFSRPGEDIILNLVEIRHILERQAQEKAQAQAALLASLPETRAYLENGARPRRFFERFCQENAIQAAALERRDGTNLPVCNPEAKQGKGSGTAVVRIPVNPGKDGQAELVVTAGIPADLAQRQQEIQKYVNFYDQLALNRKSARNFYLLLLFLLTLFILFVATWIALFLAKQISVPISSLLEASGEVRKGNLGHRVQVKAIDELGTLVRSFNEMTEALETNRRELESRRRFTEAILESIPTGVISLSPDGGILKVNDALKRIFSEEQVAQAARLEDLFTRDDTAEVKYLMKRARRIGFASSQMELRTGRQTLHLAITVSALETKVTSGFVLVLEDTSELLRAQKAAAWREVARRIAHEVRNPLTPITLSAQRIVSECTATIVQEVESLKALLDEFSQFARFPSAQPVPGNLNEVVESGLSVFAGRLDGVEIHKELAPSLPLVNLDREQFKRVVTNLVDNAAEAMQESPVKRLYIATQPTAADTVELIIADTGSGISPEDREKLFLPYFSTKGRGTGLGLAIVNHILSEHNAHIRVEDNAPAGARFIIEIPALAAGDPEPKPAEARA